MQDKLSPVWKEVERYIQEGLSVIPIRDKQEGARPPKSPYGTWKGAQITALDMPALWQQMEHYQTTAVGIVCGAVSGNLEVIDIDVKYKSGIDGDLFKHLKEFYPELLDRLRIQKTPSGGFHIIYRCETPVPGNQKLAGRAANDKELIANPKVKTYHFLETRGEGGYIAAAPALGYTVRKANPIPILSQNDRDSLINFCRSFNDMPDVVREYKPTATENSIYDENPFDDFNGRVDGPQLAQDLGWVYIKHSGDFTWLTRPEGTKGNVHLSWGATKRLFKCFTSKTDLEEKSYTPSNFVGVLKFGGDKKKLYAWLVENGYGKVKPKVEAKFVKQAAINGTGFQANFSEEARQQFEAEKEKLAKAHPFGIFWETDFETNKIVISRERLYTVAEGLGFRLWRGDIVRIVGKFVHQQSVREFYNALTIYIKEDDGDLAEDIFNSTDSFLQQNGKHIVSMLEILLPGLLLNDTRKFCNKFFTNGFLEISVAGFELKSYSSTDKLILYSRVRNREFKAGKGGLYVDYLDHAIGITDYLQNIIGYLSHEYKDNSLAYIIILTEQVPDPKDGGGSGKNLFGHLLKGTTSLTGKAASQTKLDEKVFQIWKGERIFAINDLPPDFDLRFFKDISSDGFIDKKLFKDEKVVEGGEAVKLLLSTNYSYKISDGGLRRRVIPLEFTNFFTIAGSVGDFYGKMFPQPGGEDDWDENDWAGYDNFIAESVHLWLSGGLKLKPQELSSTGWDKQFIQLYTQTAFDFISKFWLQWLEIEFISNEDFKKQLDDWYLEHGTTNDRFKLSPQKLNEAITSWAEKHGFLYKKEHVKKVEFNIAKKGRLFIDNNKTPF